MKNIWTQHSYIDFSITPLDVLLFGCFAVYRGTYSSWHIHSTIMIEEEQYVSRLLPELTPSSRISMVTSISAAQQPDKCFLYLSHAYPSPLTSRRNVTKMNCGAQSLEFLTLKRLYQFCMMWFQIEWEMYVAELQWARVEFLAGCYFTWDWKKKRISPRRWRLRMLSLFFCPYCLTLSVLPNRTSTCTHSLQT